MIEDIYSIVPEKAYSEEELEDDKRNEIFKFLEERKGMFFTAKIIAKETGLPTRGTQVEVRKYITQLIEIDEEPIVANAKGFSYAVHPNQVRFYANALNDRIKGIQRRINKLNKIASDMNVDSLKDSLIKDYECEVVQ